MIQPKPIEVFLGPPPLGGFARRPPLIEVYLAADPTWSPGSADPPSSNGRPYRAVLDTGADFCALDHIVAEEIGAEITENGHVNAFGGATKNLGRAIVQVFLPTALQTFETRFANMDFRGAGQPWNAILGRDFLRHCHFVVDGPRSQYHLEWIGAAPAARKSE